MKQQDNTYIPKLIVRDAPPPPPPADPISRIAEDMKNPVKVIISIPIFAWAIWTIVKIITGGMP
jgi:hypothetical protein